MQARKRKAVEGRLVTVARSTMHPTGASTVIVPKGSLCGGPPFQRGSGVPSFIWLHGFASGPQSSKGRFVQARLAERGVALQIPDLNAPSFRELTVRRMLAQVDTLAGAEPAVLFGSSLGGYTAALWAAQNPARCTALVLLAPAFDLGPRWAARMGEAEVERWRREGTFAFDHYATGRKEPLGSAFLDDALLHPPFPLPKAPTLVLQGERDDVVSPDLARSFAQRLQATATPARLVLLDDGHELTKDLPLLWREIEQHLRALLPIR
jgi:pimeloyl-ACP methyl ester carboxylesterase